ncbi:MAG: hypothetical protein IPM29_25930 [Planctomycetes bacterium]|nr:hypothetical protein [Planctomycetota bacterium]
MTRPAPRALRPVLVAGALALLAGACTDSSYRRDRILTDAEDVVGCLKLLDGQPTTIGSFRIQILDGEFESFLEEGSISATFTSEIVRQGGNSGPRHGPRSPITLSLDSGSPLELGSNEIDIVLQDTDFEQVRVSFLAEVVGRRISDRSLAVFGIDREFVVTNTCVPVFRRVTPPQRIVETITGVEIDDFGRFYAATPTGVPTLNANPLIDPQVPTVGYTETFEVGSVVVDLDQQQLDDAFLGPNAVFPVGQGTEARTFEALTSSPMMPGRYLISWQCVEVDVPLENQDWYLQYALVLDRDGDTGNNYQGTTPFENDPFNGTDTWLILQYDRFSGWLLSSADARSFPPNLLTTACRAILQGQVLLWVVPIEDFGGPPAADLRHTCFAHAGDFGQIGPWSADATPRIDEPLLRIALEPSF